MRGKTWQFDPSRTDVNFYNCQDTLVTNFDSQMPDVWAALEWDSLEQPANRLDATDVKVRFPHLQAALIDFADSLIFNTLTTYTQTEAKGSVRQAKRPNGFETC